MFLSSHADAVVPSSSSGTHEKLSNTYETRLLELIATNQRLKRTAERQRQLHQQQVDALQAEHRGELDRVVAEHAEQLRQLPALRSQLRNYQAELQVDLGVSQSRYDALRARAEDSLTLKEFVLMRVHEHTLPMRERAEQDAKNLEAAREALETANLRIERDQRLFRHQNSMDKQQRHAADEEVALLQSTVQELRGRLAAVTAESEKNKAQSKMYEESNTRRMELERLLKQVTHTKDTQAEMLKNLSSEKEEVSLNCSRMEQQLRMLHKDKSYLTANNTAHTKRVHELEQKLARSKEKARAAKASMEKFQQQMVECREHHRREFETKLHSELKVLKGYAHVRYFFPSVAMTTDLPSIVFLKVLQERNEVQLDEIKATARSDKTEIYLCKKPQLLHLSWTGKASRILSS